MAKSKEQKKEIIQIASDEFKSAKVILFSNFTGIPVNSVQTLRRTLREQKANYIVLKKKLLPIALAKAGIKVKNIALPGSLAIIASQEDEVQPAKILAEFIKENEGVELVGGLLSGELLSAEEANSLAKLPSQEELYAKLVYLLNYPATGLVNALAGNLRNLVNVLNNIKDNKEEAEAV